uniref:Uncharacterized protein n=1 Tax=Setaria digitata TaxID=48799 RepID=A0A915PVK0_9BILA
MIGCAGENMSVDFIFRSLVLQLMYNQRSIAEGSVLVSQEDRCLARRPLRKERECAGGCVESGTGSVPWTDFVRTNCKWRSWKQLVIPPCCSLPTPHSTPPFSCLAFWATRSLCSPSFCIRNCVPPLII